MTGDLVQVMEVAQAGGGHPEDLLRAVCEAELVLPLAPDGGVRCVPSEGCAWLVVCTGPEELAAFAAAAGAEPRSAAITGWELVGALLPRLPTETGIVLNPAGGAGLSLPPALLRQATGPAAASTSEDGGDVHEQPGQ